VEYLRIGCFKRYLGRVSDLWVLNCCEKILTGNMEDFAEMEW
jgi:hypothetical protein